MLASIGAMALGLGAGTAPSAGAAGAATPAVSNRPITPATHLPAGVTPKVSPRTPRSAPAGAHLNYYGGKVIPNVAVTQVLYGSGTYTTEVQNTAAPSIASFYGGVTDSPYLDMLSEYNTVGVTPSGGGASSNQTIGRGGFAGQVAITPSAGNSGSTVDDTQIQAELVAQIQAGHLAMPTQNTLYALYFPANVTITQGGSSSGVQFCAYHGTVAATGNVPEFYYSVLPDFTTGGMTSGCGNGTRFQNETSVSSHEMAEAITDAEVGIGTVIGPPLAWYDPTYGENGDICNAQQQAIIGGDGRTYTVQQEFSNLQNNCVAGPPATANDFSIALNPTSASITAGGSSATSTVSTAVVSGSPGTVSLSASGLPAGASASFNPASVAAGSSSTLSLSATANTAPGTYSITVTGTAGSKTHTAGLSLTVTSQATNNFSIALNPTSLSLAANAQGTSAVSTAVTAGSAGTVSLSVSGTPSGSTASVNPTSVTAGNGATLTVNAGTAAAGTYTITVTGTEGSATHSATLSLTVTGGTGGGGITNGGFETGTLAGWTSAGTTAVVSSGAQAGTYAARAGGTAPTNGDSSLSQTFTAPANTTGISFYYNVTCPDTVTYDWATATLKDNTANTTTTPLAKTCVSSSGWKQVTAAAVAGHSYTLTLTSHDDNYPGDPTFALFDSVSVTTSVPANDFSIASSPTSGTVTAGSSATASISTAVTSGAAGAVALSASAPSGVTASLNPTSVTAGGSSTLTVSTTSGTAAGTYTVTVTGTEGSMVHSTTFALTVTAASGGGVTNGGFETGTFAGWTTSGASTSVVTTTPHSGTYAGRGGTTTPTNGDSNIVQTFTAPSGTTHVGFWYKMTCPDTLTYDWAIVTLKDNTTNTTVTILPKVCTSNAWTSVTGSVTAGHSYTLTLTSHDDNYSADPSFTLFDDITLS